MRYQSVVAQFEALVRARNECSREWRLSESVVMCVEFDMFAAARMSLAIPNHTESRHGSREDRLLKVLFFDVGGQRAVRVDSGIMTPDELKQAAEFTSLVDAWVTGAREDLPPSTSTQVADRLRG